MADGGKNIDVQSRGVGGFKYVFWPVKEGRMSSAKLLLIATSESSNINN